jgi:hypothetical protein
VGGVSLPSFISGGGAGLVNSGTTTTLTNSGTISGGVGGRFFPAGAGVSNASGATIRSVTNQATGTISGGNGGIGFEHGGAGVDNSKGASIGSLSNATGATVSGGRGATGSFGAQGGAAIANSGTIAALTNSGTIGGGAGGGVTFGGVVPGTGRAAGAGIANSAAITALTNSGKIRGGQGGIGYAGFDERLGGAGGAGVSNAGAIGPLVNGGEILGGAGVVNAAMIASLGNSGMIAGGNGGSATGAGGRGGAGGAGIANSGTIATLSNRGTIEGGAGGAGAIAGAAGDAISSAGRHASIGQITNSGQIIGNVEIDNQTAVGVTGGTGKTFGSWAGGTITIGNGDLTFVGSNTVLGDNISVNGGKGTVTNKGLLRLAAPRTITGNFTRAAAGALGLDFAGDVFGQYGALTTTSLTTLDGSLAIDLTGGFTLTKGDRFDILGFASLTGGFGTLSLDGAACSSAGVDKWACGGVRLREVIDATSLDLVVAHGSAGFGPGGSSPIPEPSTWAMLALGFLGLGGGFLPSNISRLYRAFLGLAGVNPSTNLAQMAGV